MVYFSVVNINYKYLKIYLPGIIHLLFHGLKNIALCVSITWKTKNPGYFRNQGCKAYEVFKTS